MHNCDFSVTALNCWKLNQHPEQQIFLLSVCAISFDKGMNPSFPMIFICAQLGRLSSLALVMQMVPEKKNTDEFKLAA